MSWICKPMLFALGACVLFGMGLPPLSHGAKGSDSQPKAFFLQAGSTAGQGLSFTADQLDFRPAQKKIILKGRVSLSSGELFLKAQTLTVLLDAGGKPVLLQAQGQVSFKLGQSQGSAHEAHLLTKANQITLIGAVRLQLADMELDLFGDRVELDLLSGKVSVQSARARFRYGP